MQRCSVVMPCYENRRTLLACLRSFTALQKVRPLEVVVVDDGSTEAIDDVVRDYASPVPVTLLHTQRLGQSAATNAGIVAARGEVVLLTCADIVATPELVRHHLAAHAQAAQQGDRVAVAGHIAYAPWVKMTPFMRFLAGPGPQFNFDEMTDPENVNPTMLYAPNVSVRRADLNLVGGFDVGFPYGFQDTDLGLRLGARGVRFVYRAKARVLHDHPNDLRNFMRRNRMVGAYIPKMLRRYPDATMRQRCRNSVLKLVPLLDNLPQLVRAADEVEAALGVRRHLEPEGQQKLFALYNQALGLAFVEGLLASGEQAREVLGFDAAAWLAATGSSVRRRTPGDVNATGALPC